MNLNQKNDIVMLFASFGLSYCLYQSASELPWPLTVIGAVVVIVMLVKVSQNENVS